MRVETIEISNFKGIEHLVAKPGTVTILRGRNGAGKTSFIDAIRTIFEGGYDPEFIRTGCDRAEVVLTLSDGTAIRKAFTRSKDDDGVEKFGYKLDVRGADGSTIRKPQAYVEDLAKSFAFDPMGFITADSKARTAYLLRAMPVEFSREEILATAGPGTVKTLRPSYSIEELNALIQGKRDERTEKNRAFRQIDGTITTLHKAIEADDPTDWAECLADRRAALATVELELREKISAHEQTAVLYQENAKTERDLAIAELERQIREAREACGAKIQESMRILDTNKQYAHAEYSPKLDEIKASIAVATEKVARQHERAGALVQIDELRKERAGYGGAATHLELAIDRLEALKKAKLAELPISGVEIRDGEIYLDGISFDHLNKQRQMFLAVQVASLATGKLPLIISDGFEQVDSENLKDFCEAIAGTNLQVIAARVDDGAEKLEVVSAA
jgi:DNA repair exonuclease SbcCD ATPase subunit